MVVEAADVVVEVARGPAEDSPPRRALRIGRLLGRAPAGDKRLLRGRAPAVAKGLPPGLQIRQPAQKLHRARLAAPQVRASLLHSAQGPPQERRIAPPHNVQRLVS